MTSTGEKKRKKRRFLKPILIIVLSVILLVVILMSVTSVICSLIFSRHDPEQNLKRCYSDELSTEYPRTQLSFDSGDNTLCGYLYEAEEPHGLIVIAHGMRGNNYSHLTEAMYFVENNWSVFTFDGTGTSDSTGDSSIGLQQMVFDLRAAIDFITTREGLSELPLMLYGHSMGGYASTIVAEENDKIEAVVSISAFNSPMQLMLTLGKDMVGDIPAISGYPFLYLNNYMKFGTYVNRSATDAINNSDASFYIIYGTADSIICEDDSIYVNKEQVTNSNTTFLLMDQAPRNQHSTAWLTSEAVEYRMDLEADIVSKQEENGGRLDDDIYAEYYDSVDKGVLYDLDDEFMSSILDFYMTSLK